MKTKKVLLILPVLLIASLACSVFGIDLQGGGVNFDIRISESQLNTGDLSINIGELFTGNYNVDLQPGVMVLSGVLVRPNGTETRGQAEVGIRANNGALEVEILAVDADGIDINDSRVQNLQRNLEENLSRAFAEQDFVSIESVEVTDQEIVITVRGSLGGGGGQ